MTATNTTEFDLLGLGGVAVDDFLYIDQYPAPDEKVAVKKGLRQCGGLTATALVTAIRLGLRCAYAGRLGSDDMSDYVRRTLEAEGISLEHACLDPNVRPYLATIVVDTTHNTRNVFFQRPEHHGAADHHPSETLIRKARVLYVDHMGIAGQIRAAGIARRHGIDVTGDPERVVPRHAELLRLINHIVLPKRIAFEITGEATIERALPKLWHEDAGAVVITAGQQGAYFQASPSEPIQHQPAFTVKAVDTTGCGDVFHGAYAAALALSLPLAERIRWAAAAAAIKATEPGGQSGIPDRRHLERFLKVPASRDLPD